jgi:phage gp16-like protein
MKTIDTETRRKIFGLLKTAHEKSGSPLSLEDFRKQQQLAVGIASLSDCPASFGLKLLNRLHRIIQESEDKGQVAEASRNGAAMKAARTVRMDGHPFEGQLKKVYALLTDQSLSWEYADGMAARMYKQKRVEQLKPNELRGLIAALTKRQQKHGGRREQAHV